MKAKQLRILRKIKDIATHYRGEQLKDKLIAFCNAEIQKLSLLEEKTKYASLHINFTDNKDCTNGYINKIFHIHTFPEDLKRMYEENAKLQEDKLKLQQELIDMLKEKLND